MREIKKVEIEIKQSKIEAGLTMVYEVTIEDEYKHGKVSFNSKEKLEGFLEGFKFLKGFLNLDVLIKIHGFENLEETK